MKRSVAAKSEAFALSRNRPRLGLASIPVVVEASMVSLLTSPNHAPAHIRGVFMPDSKVVRYGARIQLQHVSSRHVLKSHGKRYKHQGTSGQQMVVATTEFDGTTQWIVAAIPAEELARRDEPVTAGAIVHLIHPVTRRKLHSHNAPAPINRDHQEITAFEGEDENNDWIVQPESGEKWHEGQPVRLVHRATDKALHSHSSSDPILTDGYYEVTG